VTRGSLPVTHLGWQVVDPGAEPVSPLIDRPPDTPDPQAQRDWRRRVEADGADRARLHARRPLWFPVHKRGGEHVVPFFGGRPSTWAATTATLTASMVRGNFARVSVANLTRTNALATLHRASAHAKTPWRTEAGTVSPRGSTIDVMTFGDLDDLTSVIADIVRMSGDPAGGFDAGSAKQALLKVGRCLQPATSIARLGQAVQMVLTNTTPNGASFTRGEETELRNLHGEISRRQAFRDDLDRLERNLASLACFAKAPGTTPRRMGQGPLRVKTIEITPTTSAHEFVVAQQVLANFLSRFFGQAPAPAGPQALVVIGADAVPDHLLDSLIGSADRHGKLLLLLFEHLDDRTRLRLGSGGSRTAVFFALQNSQEAEIAAQHLGREYTFVVNGTSYSESASEQWSSTHTVTTDESTSRALSFGREFGRTLTRGFSRGRSTADQYGGGTGRERGTTYGRVHEYVIEPEEFQKLPETAMLVIDDKAVTLGDCDPAIRTRPTTATLPYRPGSY